MTIPRSSRTAECSTARPSSREANEVDVLDRERLVRRRKSRRQPALVGSAHRHVGRRHVVVDEDVVDLVPQVSEAGAQPVTRRGRTLGSVTAFSRRFVGSRSRDGPAERPGRSRPRRAPASGGPQRSDEGSRHRPWPERTCPDERRADRRRTPPRRPTLPRRGSAATSVPIAGRPAYALSPRSLGSPRGRPPATAGADPANPNSHRMADETRLERRLDRAVARATTPRGAAIVIASVSTG